MRDCGMFSGSIDDALDHLYVVNRSILTFFNGTQPERSKPG